MPNLTPPPHEDNDTWGPYVSSDSHDPYWNNMSPREWARQQDSIPSELPPQSPSFSTLSRNLRRLPRSALRRIDALPIPSPDPTYDDPLFDLPRYSEQDPNLPEYSEQNSHPQDRYPSRWNVGNPNIITKSVDSYHKGKKILSEIHYKNGSSTVIHYRSDGPNNVEYSTLSPYGHKYSEYQGQHPLTLQIPHPDHISTYERDVPNEHHEIEHRIHSDTRPGWKKETVWKRADDEAPDQRAKKYIKLALFEKENPTALEVLRGESTSNWVRHERWPLAKKKRSAMSNGQKWAKSSGTLVTKYPNGIEKQIQKDGTIIHHYPNGVRDINRPNGSKKRTDDRTGRKIIYTSPNDEKYPNSILHVEQDNSATLYTQSGVHKGIMNNNKFEPNESIPENVPHDPDAASALVTAPDNEFINMPEKIKFNDYHNYDEAEI